MPRCAGIVAEAWTGAGAERLCHRSSGISRSSCNNSSRRCKRSRKTTTSFVTSKRSYIRPRLVVHLSMMSRANFTTGGLRGTGGYSRRGGDLLIARISRRQSRIHQHISVFPSSLSFPHHAPRVSPWLCAPMYHRTTFTIALFSHSQSHGVPDALTLCSSVSTNTALWLTRRSSCAWFVHELLLRIGHRSCPTPGPPSHVDSSRAVSQYVNHSPQLSAFNSFASH